MEVSFIRRGVNHRQTRYWNSYEERWWEIEYSPMKLGQVSPFPSVSKVLHFFGSFLSICCAIFWDVDVEYLYYVYGAGTEINISFAQSVPSLRIVGLTPLLCLKQ